MTLTINATVTPGQGDAATNHRPLIQQIAKRFPEVANCSAFGTINLQLDQRLDRSHADFWTPQMYWMPVRLGDTKREPRLEAFGFIRIRFECPLGGPKYAAWIMLPEGANLTYREDHAEIIAGEFVEGVAYRARCAVHLDHTPALPAPPWFGENYGKSFKRAGVSQGKVT